MISEFQNTALDQRQFDGLTQPAARMLLYSRWIDSDSDIVNGVAQQDPIDITAYVTSATLTLSSEGNASSCSVDVSLEERGGRALPVDLFYQCALQVYEGDELEPPEGWVPTFFGFHVGQPEASEANTQSLRSTAASLGQRGRARLIRVTFVSRDRTFSRRKITSPGVWLPKGETKNPNPDYQFRDGYDDVGRIAREIATARWGMDLTGGEVLIGPLPFRIEKQLQVVQDSALDALRLILEPLHLAPFFNGRGFLSTYSLDVKKQPVRTYPDARLISLPQTQSNQRRTNVVKITGLDSEITEIEHDDQRLITIQGTFGYFDSEMDFRGVWGDDETRSWRVRVPSVRIVNFTQEGFIIEPVNPPDFIFLDEFEYHIRITNDVFLVVAAIAVFLGGYFVVSLLSTLIPEIDTGGGGDLPNPGAIAAEISAALLLLAGITVLQQIGNFSFEVHGIPFESVYAELSGEAVLSNFATFDAAGGNQVRNYEAEPEEFENHLLSSLEDRTTDDGTVNKGLRTWAKERLAVEVARGALRVVNTPRDILLEPGDAIVAGGQVIHAQTITRRIQRGSSDPQTVSGFQIRKGET